MQLRASRCYYHPESGAVATCAKCGVGVCEKCVAEYEGRILCYRCANEYLEQAYKEDRKWLKERGGRFREGREFILPGIIGVLIIAAIVAVDHYLDTGRTLFNDSWWENLFIAYVFFSMPFAYIFAGDFLRPKFNSGLNADKRILKIVISFTLGWLIFLFILLRFIIGKITSKRKDSNQ